MTPDQITRLVERAVERDQEAFADLVEATKDRLIRRVRRRGLQHADAEAVAFTVYREAWKWMTRLRDPSRFESWIAVVGRRKAAAIIRSGRARAKLEETLTEGHLDSLAAESEVEAAARRREELDRLFAGMSKSDRALLEAKYLHRVTIEEIARVAGLKIYQIKHRIKRARQKLRRLRPGAAEDDREEQEPRAEPPGIDVGR